MRVRYRVVLVLILVVIASTAALWWSQQPQSHSVQWLGAAGGFRSGVYDVSADGRIVVGYVELQAGRIRPVFWQRQGDRWQIHYIPLPNEMHGVAFGVSASGEHIVGSALSLSDGKRYGFVWSRTAGVQLLASSESIYHTESARWARGLWEGAYDVADDGRLVVGMVGKDGIGYWQAHGDSYERRALPLETNLWGKGYTTAVSACKTLIGGQLFFRPAIWRREGNRWRLTLLDNENCSPAEVADVARIGDSVVAVGTQRGSVANYQATRWIYQSGKWRAQPLCNKPSQARRMSRDGSVVVGRMRCSRGAYDTAAFYWSEARGLVDLNELYDRELRHWLAIGVLKHWLERRSSVLLDATAVTEDGRYVVGRGYNARTGREEAYIARLE